MPVSAVALQSVLGPSAHRVENNSAVVIYFFRSLLVPVTGFYEYVGRAAPPRIATELRSALVADFALSVDGDPNLCWITFRLRHGNLMLWTIDFGRFDVPTSTIECKIEESLANESVS